MNFVDMCERKHRKLKNFFPWDYRRDFYYDAGDCTGRDVCLRLDKLIGASNNTRNIWREARQGGRAPEYNIRRWSGRATPARAPRPTSSSRPS